VGEGLVRLDLLADLIPVLLRHDDVAKDDVGPHVRQLLESEAPVANGDDVEVLIREGQLDHLLDRDAVVGEQDLLGHPLSQIGPPLRAATRTLRSPNRSQTNDTQSATHLR
jgi:hypothetical protein